MISRGLVLGGGVAAVAYLARVALSYQNLPDDRIALLFALKVVLVLAVSLHFLLSDGRTIQRLVDRLAVLADRPSGVLLAAVILIPVGIALLTTPQIGFGEGALGRGYGHDGAIYGEMAEHFAWFTRPGYGRFGYRFFPVMLVHYSGLSTFVAFRVLDLASYVLGSVLAYAIARHFALPRSAALLMVAFLAVLKFGLKFLVYYPVLYDGIGFLLLMAILWATLEQRHVLYLIAMAAGPGTRENLIALTVFNALHVIRTGTGRRRFLTAVALQIPALAFFALNRRYPVFPPFQYPGSVLDLAAQGARWFVLNPAIQWNFVLAHVNSLGVLAILPLLSWRRFAAFLGERYEWAYYVGASLALSVVGGVDYDRYAVSLAPIAILGLLAIDFPREGHMPRIWIYWLLLQVIAMEFVFPWFPEERFYMSRCAAHAKGLALVYIAAFSWVLTAVVATLRLNEPAPRAPAVSR